VLGQWFDGDNLAEYEKNRKQGLTPQQAAAQTWTGRQAARWGYTEVIVVTDNRWDGVIVEFRRP
jgi:hypothetical protein